MKAQDFTFIVKNGSEQDGVKFVVEYPEFPGIVGGGDDIFTAITEAQEALQMFIDYRIRENRQIIEKKTGRITLRIPSSMHFLCDEYSKLEGVSLNTFIIDALSEKIYSYKKTIDSKLFFRSSGYLEKPEHLASYTSHFETSYRGENNGESSYIH